MYIKWVKQLVVGSAHAVMWTTRWLSTSAEKNPDQLRVKLNRAKSVLKLSTADSPKTLNQKLATMVIRKLRSNVVVTELQSVDSTDKT